MTCYLMAVWEYIRPYIMTGGRVEENPLCWEPVMMSAGVPLQTTENTHNAFKLQALILSIDFHTKPPPSEETHVNKDWVMLLESSSAFLVVHSHSWATRDRWVEENRRMIKIDAIEVKIPWLWFPRMCQTSEMLDHAFPCCHRQPVFVWPSLSSCPQRGAQASC